MSLCDLAEETLDQIALYASGPGLYGLSLASKQLHRICLPYLYRHVRIVNSGATSGLPSPQLRRLTIRLFENPELASCVESFSIRPAWVFRRSRRRDVHSTLRSAAVARAETAKEANSWTSDLAQETREDALLALLLPALPNLKSLELGLPLVPGPWYTHLLDQLSKLGSLEEVVVVTPTSYPAISRNHYGVKHLHPFVHYLGVRTLRIHGLRDHELSRPLWGINQWDVDRAIEARKSPDSIALSPLEHVEVSEGDVLMLSIMDLLEPHAALRTFIYESGVHACHQFRPDQLLLSLQLHKDSLTDVSISYASDQPPPLPSTWQAPDFTGFTRLKRLRIASAFLVDPPQSEDPTVYLPFRQLDSSVHFPIDTLPENLQTLTVVNAEHQTEKLLGNLFRLSSNQAVGVFLKAIEIEGKFQEDAHLEDFAKLNVMAKSLEMSLGIYSTATFAVRSCGEVANINRKRVWHNEWQTTGLRPGDETLRKRSRLDGDTANYFANDMTPDAFRNHAASLIRRN